MIQDILKNPKVAAHVVNARSYHEHINDERSRPVKLLHTTVPIGESAVYLLQSTFDEVYSEVLSNPLVDHIRDTLKPIYRDMQAIGVKCAELTVYATTTDRDRFYGHFHIDFECSLDDDCRAVTYIAPVRIEQPVTERLSVTLTSDYLDILKESQYNTMEGLVKTSAMMDQKHMVSDRKQEFFFSADKILRLRFDARKWFHSVEGFSGNLFLIVLCNSATSNLGVNDLIMESL